MIGMPVTRHHAWGRAYGHDIEANLTNVDLGTSHIHCRMILNLKPCSWVDGCLGLFDSMVTLWCARKCHTKLYLVVYDAPHPSTLQTNSGPSLAQWTPFMVIGGGATTSMVTPSMVTKATSKTKKTNTINLIWELTFWMKVISTQWGY